MSTSPKQVSIHLAVGQEIMVGKFRNSRARITKIEVAASGDVVLKTTKGERNALTFKLVEEEYPKSKEDNHSGNVENRESSFFHWPEKECSFSVNN